MTIIELAQEVCTTSDEATGYDVFGLIVLLAFFGWIAWLWFR